MFRILILAVVLTGVGTAGFAMERPVQCPDIKLIEPPGLVSAGDTADFRLEPDLKQQRDIRVEWSVSFGQIENGQGTTSIAVRTALEHNFQTMKVKAVIKGLPNECVGVFEGTAIVGCCFDPIVLDEWGKLPADDQRGRLDNVLQELINNPADVALIILDSGKGKTEKDLLKRVKFIKDHIFGHRKFQANRIVIVSEPASHGYQSVKVYRLPPGLVKSFCPNCRIHN